MSKSHKKKRNTGLLYEFLVRHISKSLVEGNQKAAGVGLKILKKHFKPGTQLYKEFRLINSLVKTTVTSDAVAMSILQEARAAASDYDEKELDREKSLLIRAINHKINEATFYDQHVPEYRTYATIQMLLNDWRSGEYFDKRAQFEDQLVQHLITEKAAQPDTAIDAESPGTNRLLMKIMMTKLNEKYSGVLTNEQKDVIRAYVWATTNDDSERIKTKLQEVRDQLLSEIDRYTSDQANAYLKNQLSEARQRLIAESFDSVDDEVITRVMLYMKLQNELVSEEGQQ